METIIEAIIVGTMKAVAETADENVGKWVEAQPKVKRNPWPDRLFIAFIICLIFAPAALKLAGAW